LGSDLPDTGTGKITTKHWGCRKCGSTFATPGALSKHLLIHFTPNKKQYKKPTAPPLLDIPQCDLPPACEDFDALLFLTTGFVAEEFLHLKVFPDDTATFTLSVRRGSIHRDGVWQESTSHASPALAAEAFRSKFKTATGGQDWDSREVWNPRSNDWFHWEGSPLTRPKGPCGLCGETHTLSKHHLVPSEIHAQVFDSKTREFISPQVERLYQGNVSGAEKWLRKYVVDVCKQCHVLVHIKASNFALGTKYNTKKLLQELIKTKQE
jgi:ribosomal protein S27AE